MKINRLLEITILLLSRGTVTAKALGERFGVSTRTIYRDIEALSASGVPVYTDRGAGGGISLMENYTLSKTLLSDRESESLLFALKTLEATRYPGLDGILDKLGALLRTSAPDWIEIDFSPWGSDPNAHDKLYQIKNAVLGRSVLEFDYINAQNQKAARRVEPLKLVFKSRAWYLWGWDLQREDYRMFRVSRIKRVNPASQTFDRGRKREPKAGGQRDAGSGKPPVPLELRFGEDALYRLYDDFDDGDIVKNGDGTYTVRIAFPEDDWVYGYILSFGPSVEVVSPDRVRRIVREKAQKTLENYP